MARSASDNTEGLTFTGADIWVPRDQLVGTRQFGIPTGYYSAVVRQTTGTVSNGGGRPAPSRWARTTRTTSCALPRRLPPMHILNSTASDFQTHRTLRAGPAPRMLPWPPSRDLAAPAPAGSQGQHESRRGRAPSSVVRAGRAAGPTQPAASEHFPADPRQRAGQLRAHHGSSGWDVGLHNPALSTVA